MPQEIKEQPISAEFPQPGSSPELPSSPESREREPQFAETGKTDEILKKIKKSLPGVKPQMSTGILKEKSRTLKQIEDILSEDMGEIYKNLPDDLKGEFKKKGEETASKIEQLIIQVKVAVNKIVDLIKQWLLVVPGVNKFFLEQETKIKTDKILALAEKEKNNKI